MHVNIPKISEDEAYNFIVSYLRHSKKDGDAVNILSIINDYASQHKPKPNRTERLTVSVFDPHQKNAAPFHCATWRLCNIGVLAPRPKQISGQGGVSGSDFLVTEYGQKWLDNLADYDYSPTEYGRFSTLLAAHSERFGNGYHARSQEAISCYRAQAYLACCAMCGAASESILLALAVAKTNNEERVLKDYGTTTGRTKIEKLLLSQQGSFIHRELPNYMGLLKYWRDDAAHGADTNISESEAFTSLLLLLRFAQFSDEKWVEITASSSDD
jgi:hypothetical protein